MPEQVPAHNPFVVAVLCQRRSIITNASVRTVGIAIGEWAGTVTECIGDGVGKAPYWLLVTLYELKTDRSGQFCGGDGMRGARQCVVVSPTAAERYRSCRAQQAGRFELLYCRDWVGVTEFVHGANDA